ncbi:hypothetical protein [Desmospora activa]|uniref:Uncharacterized protein n=1 Tax=Desmospora activa DSM 45169 TaxID=1121389 RepID=A0A2T4Z971_9BACL|nr:hypothetical protein [Desmospora activa]PTM58442.1 hypothetical protein C8J48_1025 [Desmospora activa DSM 45169]
MSEHRRQIFKSELQKLKYHQYLSEKSYNHLLSLYDRFYAQNEQAVTQQHQPAPSVPPSSQHKKQSAPLKPSQQSVKKTEKVKPQRSPQEIRDRNISITLILGVMLLLTSGLIVGTSTWDVLTAPMKVLSIALVSVLFYSISYLSGTWLKIRKTSFAFLTMAHLFIPIILISAGFFQLFGTWLSLTGEGKYLLGALISLLCLPIYAWTAVKFQSRLFIWLSFITSTVFVGSLLSPAYFTRDLFFCGLIVYNAALLGLYHKNKNRAKYRLFLKELPLYSQTNLILSSLLMLFIYDQAIFHSFNLFITAGLYLAMMFVYRTKEYQFVFSALLAYGFYQLVENTFLQTIDVILIAAFGSVFLGLQSTFNDDPYLHKMFQYTAAWMSAAGFLFTGYHSLASFTEGSWLILIAYAILALHYTYLAHLTKKLMIAYLGSVFIVVTGFESWRLLPFLSDFGEIYMFTIATLLFFSFYYKTFHPYLRAIKNSSLVNAGLVMMITIITALIQLKWLTTSFLLAIFGLSAFLLYRRQRNQAIRSGLEFVIPLSWILSISFLYQPLHDWNMVYGSRFGVPFHLCLSTLILVAISRTGLIIRHKGLEANFFWISQLTYSLGLLLIFTPLPIDATVVVPFLFAIGIAMYTWLTVKSKWKPTWVLVGLTSLVFYLSLIHTFKLDTSAQSLTIYLFTVFLLLQSTPHLLGKWGRGSKPYFAGIAHGYLGLVQGIGLVLFLFSDIHPLTFVMPLGFYVYHTLRADREWVKMSFLTLSLTYIPMLIMLLLSYYEPIWGRYVYVPLLSNLVFALVWLLGKGYRKRILQYVRPFSLLGLFSLPFYLPSDQMVFDMGLGLLYVLTMLAFLYQQQLHLFNFLPLSMLMLFLVQWHYYFGIDTTTFVFVYLCCFAILTGTGRWLYTRFWENTSTLLKIEVDWYSIFALYALLTTYHYLNLDSPLWLQVLPGLLLSLFLYLQLHRTPFDIKVVKTMLWLSFLIPYYTVVINLDIDDFLINEVYLLPAILWTIFLSKYTWKEYEKTMHRLQWGVLVIVTIILVTNAIHSHTVADALKIGVLALLSVLGGLHYRIKSYFSVGVTVILLNLFVQSLPLWGLIPWWVYLLLSGTLLIAVASVYEWQKQMKERKVTPIWQVKWQQFRQKFAQWK